jgi:outer membrane protein
MKRLLALIVFAGMCTGAVAQESGRAFTLEQCIQYALENSIQTKNATVDEQIAGARVKEITGIGLPQVNGTVTLTHNEKLPRFFMAYSSQGGGFIDVGKEPNLNEGDVIAAQNFFQLKSSGDAGITINQMIFNGSYFIGLKAAKAYRDLAYRSSEQTREQIVQQITKAYYTVLINKERSNLFTTNIARVDSLLRDTRALFKNGFAESIDVDRIQVTLNNLMAERDKFENLNALGLELLKFQMNYPMSEPISVTGTINELQVEMTTDSYKEGFDYKNRPDFKLLEANKRLQELNVKNLKAESLPSLGAFANLGYSTQSSNISGLFQTNTNIAAASDTVRMMGFGADKWYNYSMFGVRLNVPLFSGFQQRNKIQQQKLTLLKMENNTNLLKSTIDLEIRQSAITFENALKTMQTQKANVDLAENVARVTKIKYEQGVGSNLEVIEAETSLKETQSNYYNALYDALIAKVDLDKAYGKLAVPAPVQK